MSEPAQIPSDSAPLPWHDTLWKRVLEMQTHGRFPHALLLSGPRGVGKERFAQRLAAALVCDSEAVAARPCGECRSCRLSQAGTHPDIHWLAPEEEGKAIRIDAVRDLIGRSTLTTQSRGMRVFVIAPAEAMNRAAANALLKTLEEPVASSCLLLVSSATHLLPATILSRCQKLLFPPVAPAAAADWLRSRADPEGADAALALAGGAPLLAETYLAQQRIDQVVRLIGDLDALKNRKANPIAVAETWAALGAQTVLDSLKYILSDLLSASAAASPRLFLPLHREDLQALIKNIHLQQQFRFMDELYRLERQLGHNLNPQMLTERLVNSWLDTTRPEKS
jgi:DNA polymerase-3 subunit delta'